MKVKIFIKLLQNKKKYLSLQTQKGTGEFLMTKMVRTGLEPATPCVTGMYSNQLNYRTS